MKSLEHYTKDWVFERQFQIADQRSSTVYKVRLSDGTSAIFKHLKPEGADEAVGGALLEWYDGAGAAKVYRHDNGAQLLEYLDGPQLYEVFDEIGDIDATLVICNIIRQLHMPRSNPPPYGLVSLKRRFQELYKKASHDREHGLDSVFVRAAEIADDLIATQAMEIPLHGDLHHENVLKSADGSWCVIDPKGLFGDPSYEFANIYCNPLNHADLTHSEERIARLTQTFSSAFSYDAVRIARFGLVHAALSASWSLLENDFTDAHHRIHVAETIMRFDI